MEDASKAGMGPLCSWHFVAQCPLTPLQVAEFKSIGGRRTLVSKKSARPSLENRSPRFIGSGMLWLLSLLYFARQMGHSGSLPSLTGRSLKILPNVSLHASISWSVALPLESFELLATLPSQVVAAGQDALPGTVVNSVVVHAALAE